MMRLLSYLLLTVNIACAQAVPTTPTKFGKRDLGLGSGAHSAAVGAQVPKQQTIIRTTTYLSLSEARQWTSSEGKPLLAKLIAFEDITVETVKVPTANETQPLPLLTGKPTVVKDGKVRLLAQGHPYLIALEKLCAADREFIGKIKMAVPAAK